MKNWNIIRTGVKVDVAAIEWPANATALIVDRHGLVCHITDLDESKEGAETSEIHIKCKTDHPPQVIGKFSALTRILTHGVRIMSGLQERGREG